MGMDVYGQNPTDETGKYFRRNVWGWRPLAAYTQKAAPEIAAHCNHWWTNDGDGLDGQMSAGLAERLDREVKSGRAEQYVVTRRAYLDALPREECRWCKGTGIRTDATGTDMRQRVITDKDHPRAGQTGWCNGCDGRGDRADVETHYRLGLNDIQEWIAFLRSCGGFEIW